MEKKKDIKNELQNAFDSFFQNEDKEKLKKELKNNLEKFFKIIEDMYGKNFHHNESADKFLEEFNPWDKSEGKKLIKGFENIVNNDNSTKDFSCSLVKHAAILTGSETSSQRPKLKHSSAFNQLSLFISSLIVVSSVLSLTFAR